MMIVFLLIVSAMLALAGEKDTPSFDITIEQMSVEDALSKVTIEAEDWLDGDTYYIRYTFANPTDVAIEKTVEYTDIRYTTLSCKHSRRHYRSTLLPNRYSSMQR